VTVERNATRYLPRLGWFVTRHALDRYLERIEPHTGLNSARKKLEEAALTALRRGKPPIQRAGDSHWVVREDPYFALITRQVRGETRIVTVLGPDDPSDERAAAERRQKHLQRKRLLAERRYEEVSEENVLLRRGLSIAVGVLQQLVCLPEAESALVALNELLPSELIDYGER